MSILRYGLVFGLLIGALVSVQAGDTKEKARGKKGPEEKFTDKATIAKLARTIEFEKDLGLNFDSLGTLGYRIDQARKTPDPVGLAAAANELAVAEKVSGKLSSLTSAALFVEAVELAKLRKHSPELKAVALLVKDEATSKDLDKLALAKSEKSRGIRGNLIVHNNTGSQLQVFEDGRHLGWVAAYGNYAFYIGHGPSFNSVISARSGGRTWGPRIIDYSVQNYNWTLN